MKFLTLALCIIAIFGSAASTFFYFQIGGTKEHLQEKVVLAEKNTQTLENQITESKAKSEVLQKRLAELDNDLGDAKSKITAAENRSTQLSREVAHLRNQLTVKTEAEQALNREISDLKREIAQAKLAGSINPDEIEGYKATITALKARLAELDTRHVQGTTPAGTATPTITAPSVSSAAYSVASVGANNAFVVINAGLAQGVQVNQRLAINRNGTTIAEAVVSSAQAGFAIAQIVSGTVQDNLMKGDNAYLIP